MLKIIRVGIEHASAAAVDGDLRPSITHVILSLELNDGSFRSAQVVLPPIAELAVPVEMKPYQTDAGPEGA